MDVLHERCAALDISKGDVKACVRVPNLRRKGARSQQVKTFAVAVLRMLAAPVAAGGGGMHGH